MSNCKPIGAVQHPATFLVGEKGFEDAHAIGEAHCVKCWPGYPQRCKREGCGGLVHAAFGDENMDGEYWLYLACDRCGEAWK